MRKVTLLYFMFLCSLSLRAQEVPVVKIDRLEEILELKSPEIVIVNFWATWCAPCIKEMPYLEDLTSRNDPNVKVILVNLDFVDDLPKVKSFMLRKKIKSEVVLLDEIDYNSWIDKVDQSWQGAIPATLIRNTKTGQRKFIAQELHEGDLERIIKELSKT